MILTLICIELNILCLLYDTVFGFPAFFIDFVPLENFAQKVSVELRSLSSVILRPSTAYAFQLQRVKPTPIGGSIVALLWNAFSEIVEVSG